MVKPGGDPYREVLLEAFTAGWQAALAVHITNPRVLAVVESCFEGWLREATGEREVLGLRFRRRRDLPRPARPDVVPGTVARRTPQHRRTTSLESGPRVPEQRRAHDASGPSDTSGEARTPTRT
jgi:hypothetical protein